MAAILLAGLQGPSTLGSQTANVSTTSVQRLLYRCCLCFRLSRLAMPAPVRRKNDVIQICASAEAKAVLNRAAALRGQKLSEFMLESARRQAEETILDQRTFFQDDKSHARFLALLDSPPKPSAKVRARFNGKRRGMHDRGDS